MKILFMGTMEYSLEVLKEISKKHEIVAVCTKKDLVIGRKKEVVFSPVKKWAIENNCVVFQKQKLREDYQSLLGLDFDCIVTASFGDFVPEELLNKGKYPPLNAHASLLPLYRGGSPIHTAIKNGDEYTGVTIMKMVKKMDAGPIILQEKIKIEDNDNVNIMFEKLAKLAARLMLSALDNIENIKMIEQDEEKVTFSPNIKPEDECIQFNLSSREVFNHIRAFDSFPGAYSTINGTKIKIYSSFIISVEANETPGTVLNITKEGIVVKTCDSAVCLTEIQISGKKRMSVKDFVNGNKLINIGDIFVADKRRD